MHKYSDIPHKTNSFSSLPWYYVRDITLWIIITKFCFSKFS